MKHPLLCLYRFSKFQDLLASQTGVAARDQLVLFENLAVEYWVMNPMLKGSEYPSTSADNPMFLYYNHNTHAPRLSEPEISKSLTSR